MRSDFRWAITTLWQDYCEDMGWKGLFKPNLSLIPFNAAMIVFCLLYHFGGTK